MKAPWRSATPLLLIAFGAACHAETASGVEGYTPPPTEIWLTRAEVAESKLDVKPAGEEVVDDSVLVTGTITLDDQRTGHVFSPVTGRVAKITAELGQRVHKGDPLAVLESPDIGQAVSDVHKAQADLIAAEHDLRRKKELLAQRAAASADVEASEDAARTARAELERARQKQFLLRVGNIDTVTQTYTLPAPVDGEVLARNINPGIEVQGQYSGGANQELFTIGELDSVWVVGDVYGVDLGRVRTGQPAQVTTVAYPDQVLKGTVDWVSGGLDPTTRTAKVRCTFANPDKLLRPLMYATVQIAVDPRRALALPREAVVRMGEYRVVFLEIGERDGRVGFERLPIDVDDREGASWLAVRHGVEAGQKIVVRGGDALLRRL
jgi:cobalt-zinc-cadmium efflux system membrane fusion protein